MSLKYLQKKYEIPFIKSKLLTFILYLPLLACFNNQSIEGERLDLYQQEMDAYLVNDGQNIRLSSQKTITSTSTPTPTPTATPTFSSNIETQITIPFFISFFP